MGTLSGYCRRTIRDHTPPAEEYSRTNASTKWRGMCMARCMTTARRHVFRPRRPPPLCCCASGTFRNTGIPLSSKNSVLAFPCCWRFAATRRISGVFASLETRSWPWQPGCHVSQPPDVPPSPRTFLGLLINMKSEKFRWGLCLPQWP
jgi:hypothetical protein